MSGVLLSGNEAIARGAWEAGATVGTGYPGTPSTEILEALAAYPEVACEWSVNEKVALEVALGASLSGARCLVTMKHVGVNVAADPLFTAAYTGVEGGLVIAAADDPSMHSSQNEQDTRHFAMAAKVPLLEPADSDEARRFTRLAFEISERFDTPVILRSTTRLSHSKSVAYPGERRSVEPTGFVRQPEKYVMLPTYARRRLEILEARLEEMARAAERSEINRVEPGSPDIGVITSGVAYTYVKEAAPDASVLKLGWIHPLPEAVIRRFAASVSALYVVEELDPFIELQVKAMGLPVIGKAVIPTRGELSFEVVRQGLLGKGAPAAGPTGVALPERPPKLCPGCPHGNVFGALKEMGMVVAGDIGCYTLGTLPPYEAIDTCLDMGASITMAQGIGLGSGSPGGKIAAVIGDSTFAHSGISGLLNACWNQRDILVVVLDNGTTAMTGMQPNPLSGETLYHRPAPALDYAHLARAVGIPDERFRTVDAYDKDAVQRALTALAGIPGVCLLVVKGLCVIERRRRKKRRGEKGEPPLSAAAGRGPEPGP